MTLWDALIHLLNFAAPALALALLLPLPARFLNRFVVKKLSPAMTWRAQSAINFAVGSAVLVVGLWVFGRDGKMSTYTALALAVATSQWLMARGWRG